MLLKVGSQLQIVNPLNKTASQVKEADTSFVTPKDDNFTYFQCIAVHADVANQNADIFPLDELKKSYGSFIGRGLFMDHNASCVANAVGKIFDAKLIELPNATADEGKYGVLCLCGIDKTTHPDIAAKVAHGVIDSVSMGANVNEAECEICHCVAHTPEEFCIHLQHQGQLDPATGKKCCSINRGVNFTELSLVSVPADPYAKMQQVFANFVGAMKKQAELPEKKWNEKFSFNIPCGNDKICEMLYNLLSSYEKQGILDLSKDGPVLKLSVEAGSKEEALQKLEYISKEQGFGVKEPLKKDTEENLMTKDNKEVKEEVKEEVKATASLGKEAFLNKMSEIYDNLAKGNIMNKEAVDTKIKDYQRQTKDFQGEPIEAPENVVDSLNQIKELRTKISEKEVELAKITQELGIEDLNDELQNVLNGAADSLKNLQGQVLRYGKQLITYQEEVKTQDFKPTITWIKEKLAKYPEALAYIEKAIDGAQNMAKKTETSTIKVYDPNNK